MTAAPAYSATPAVLPPSSDPAANGAPHCAGASNAKPDNSKQPGSFVSLLHKAKEEAGSEANPSSGASSKDKANRNSQPATISSALAVPVAQQIVLSTPGFLGLTNGTNAAAKEERAQNEHTEETSAADQKTAMADRLSPATLLMRNIPAGNAVTSPQLTKAEPATLLMRNIPAVNVATSRQGTKTETAALRRPSDNGETDQQRGAPETAPPPITLPTQHSPVVSALALPRPAESGHSDAREHAIGRQTVASMPAAAGVNQGIERQDSSITLETATAGSSRNTSDTTALPALPQTGETNAPVSSSPIAFAARLSAEPGNAPAEQQPQPATQSAPQPGHAISEAKPASEPQTVTAIQTAAQAGGSSVHTGADQNEGQQQKPEQSPLPTQSTVYERAETVRPDSVRAPEQAAQPRGAEIEPPAPSANHAQIRDVRMQLTGSENQRVDVRVLDRGGELRVSVRADDPSLVRSLQDNMADLATRLDQGHFRSEIWTPRTEAVSRSESSGTNGRTLSNGNESSGQDGQGRQQNGRQNHQPAWLDDFEESTTGNSSGGKR